MIIHRSYDYSLQYLLCSSMAKRHYPKIFFEEKMRMVRVFNWICGVLLYGPNMLGPITEPLFKECLFNENIPRCSDRESNPRFRAHKSEARTQPTEPSDHSSIHFLYLTVIVPYGQKVWIHREE